MKKPIFRILEKDGMFAVEYLYTETYLIFFKKYKCLPYLHYSGMEDELFWYHSYERLTNDLVMEIKKVKIIKQ